MGRILLCADIESLQMPQLIGLDGERLEDCEWLTVQSSAPRAREAARSEGIDEAWVVSSEEMEAVNLAGAVCADSPGLPVYMVAFDASGSERSRAHEAGVVSILGRVEFSRKFQAEKIARSGHSASIPVSVEGTIYMPVEEELELDEPPIEASRPAFVGDSLYVSPGIIDAALASSPIPASAKKSSFVASVMSGSGGVGKSTTVATAAYIVSGKGLSCVVLDCDLQFGDMHQLMGDVPRTSIDDVLADPQAFSAFADGCSPETPVLVSAPGRLERSEELSQHLGELVDACSSRFDVVLVNTGSSWSEANAQLLERSSCTIFMMDQRSSSVRSCQHALELCMRMGVATGQFVYALNRCERGSLFNAIDIANVMQGANVVELKEGGSEVEELLGCGLASELASSKNEFALSVGSMLSEVLP